MSRIDNVYRLKKYDELYPYEVNLYDPINDSKIPEWFSEILKLREFDENGNPVYAYSIDGNKNITYQVPKINGHINVTNNSVVVRNLGNSEIFTMRRDLFTTKYELINKSNLLVRIIGFLRKLVS